VTTHRDYEYTAGWHLRLAALQKCSEEVAASPHDRGEALKAPSDLIES